MTKTENQIKPTILKELSEFIVPLTSDEFAQLEKNLVEYGCRDPLSVWERDNGKKILVDGHNRYKICQKNNIPFKVKFYNFSSLEDAKLWMVDNQMARRNLTPDQQSYYRGLKYISLNKGRGGYKNIKAKGTTGPQTSEVLSDVFGVSKSTIKRDAKFALGLNIIQRSNPKLKEKILSGDAKVKKADIQILSDSHDPDKIVIKNEADLFNKAARIRNEVLNEFEIQLKKLNTNRAESLNEKMTEPIFSSKEDRLKRIKGMILSAINRAIMNKEMQALKELRKLIDKLADELID